MRLYYDKQTIIDHAENVPGIYGILKGTMYIYIGESDNVRRRLLEHCNGTSDQAPIINAFSPDWCLYHETKDGRTRKDFERALKEICDPLYDQILSDRDSLIKLLTNGWSRMPGANLPVPSNLPVRRQK